jgi:hypothetical protein
MIKILSGLKSQQSKKKLKRLPNLQERFRKMASWKQVSVIIATLVSTPLSVQAGEETLLSQPDPAFNLKIIAKNVFPGFKASFGLTKWFLIGDDDSDSETELDSDSDFETDDDIWDSPFKCKPITPEVERFVDENVDLCIPLEDKLGNYAGAFKNMIQTAKTDEDCIGLNVFGQALKSAKEMMIEENNQCPLYSEAAGETCMAICYWCCCETVKKVSPVIAKATINLLV